MTYSDEVLAQIAMLEQPLRFGDMVAVAWEQWIAIVGALEAIIRYHHSETDGYERCVGCREPWPCPDFENVAEIFGETFGL